MSTAGGYPTRPATVVYASHWRYNTPG